MRDSGKNVLLRPALLVGISFVLALTPCVGRQKTKPESTQRKVNLASGNQTFLQYCASCHGKGGKGDGPAAFVMKTPPPDLTTLAKRHEGKYPAGYVLRSLYLAAALLRTVRKKCRSGALASRN